LRAIAQSGSLDSGGFERQLVEYFREFDDFLKLTTGSGDRNGKRKMGRSVHSSFLRRAAATQTVKETESKELELD